MLIEKEEYLKLPNIENTNKLLQYIINKTRKDLDIDITKPKEASKCIDSIRYIENLLYELDIPYELNKFPFSHINITNPYHISGILGLNTIDGSKYFIIDPTYVQFAVDEYPLNNNELYIPAINYLKTTIEQSFGFKMIDNGFAPLNEDNLKMYIGSFISANNNTDYLSNPLPYIDLESSYNKVVEYLGNKVEQSSIDHIKTFV